MIGNQRMDLHFNVTGWIDTIASLLRKLLHCYQLVTSLAKPDYCYASPKKFKLQIYTYLPSNLSFW